MQLKLTLKILIVLLLLKHNFSYAQSYTFFEIEWQNFAPNGTIEIKNGELVSTNLITGVGKVHEGSIQVESANSRVRVKVKHDTLSNGPNSAVVFIKTQENPFSFFLRDISKEYPIYAPYFNAAVFSIDDNRTLSQYKSEIELKSLKTKIETIEEMAETSFEEVAAQTRNMSAPTWLGLGRDFRIFEISTGMSDDSMGEGFLITPRYSTAPVLLSNDEKVKNLNYMFSVGRGVGVYENLKRELKKGYLPILQTTLTDDDIIYRSTTFTSLEKSSIDKVKGTDYLVAAKFSAGPNMFSEKDEQYIEQVKDSYINDSEETILLHRTIAINEGRVPRYAWFRSPNPGNSWYDRHAFTYDPDKGISVLSANGLAFCYTSLNGKPMKSEEAAIMLQPGDSVVFEFYLPHKPLPDDRVADLQYISFARKLEEVESYWEGKLSSASRFSIPERRIDNMLKAGLVHLDLITYGEEPNGVLAPNVGVYSPIGTESAPIIQYYLSVGLDDLAKRSLMYFFEKQREDGFMQNFGGYMVETGAVLWTLGEYYRYTNDEMFIRKLKHKIIKAGEYLIDWREKNKNLELKGRGYGMIDGKVADPEDHYHQFMLNGYSYLGMKRAAEVLKYIDTLKGNYFEQVAKEWGNDIRESVNVALSHSPLVPLGNGEWASTLPPWTEAEGLRLLYQDPTRFWSHGTFTVSDAMLGPLYLVFCEVLAPHEPLSENLLKYHSELLYQGNSAFSQPYYSRHNWLQAKLGMVKPFLNTYYTTMSAHADRDTYTFWEHMYKVSPHKTHEEAWFLMETRWMLYMENQDTLDVFKVIPRSWMESGKNIKIEEASSYFGKINLTCSSDLDTLGKGEITADISVTRNDNSKLKVLTIRLPHPMKLKPISIVGGRYDSNSETIIVDDFKEQAVVKLRF